MLSHLELKLSENFFQLKSCDNNARFGVIKTKHGDIETPVFMPVGTLANVKAIFPHELKRIGVKILLGNTYHLMLRPGENVINKMGGLQKFMNWNLPILTDSGGFQIWSLSKLRKIDEFGVIFSSHLDGRKYKLTPESSIRIQEKLNSNITMVLDECTDFPSTFEQSKNSLELTINWAKKSKNAYKKRNGYALFSILQGGMFEKLRRESAKRLVEISFDGYAIGGLSVGESHNQMIDIVSYTTQFLPENKPRYLMGVGRPIDILNSVNNGIDMFDCVLPTRFGRNGRAFVSDGEINLRNSKFSRDENPLDSEIDCHVSKNFSRGYIHHLTKSNEILSSMILSLHNIAFYQRMMSEIRNSIKNRTFKEIMKKYIENHKSYEKT